MPNRDTGFVEPGQEAEIKVSTFNFTRYGLLHGKVRKMLFFLSSEVADCRAHRVMSTLIIA